MFGRKLHFAVSERIRASFCKNTDLKLRRAWPDVWGALPEKGFQPEAAPSETRGHPGNGGPASPRVAVAEDSAAAPVLWGGLEVSGPPGPKAAGAQLLVRGAEWSPGTREGLRHPRRPAPPAACSFLICTEPARSAGLSG